MIRGRMAKRSQGVEKLQHDTTAGAEPFTAPYRALRQPRSLASSFAAFHVTHSPPPQTLILEDTVRNKNKKKGLPHMMKK